MAISCWPAHPQPLPDELFSSWIHRAARENGQKFFSLCYLTAPEIRNIHHNYDYAITKSVLRLFADKLRTPYQEAYRTTLDSYAGYLYAAATKRRNRKHSILLVGRPQEEYRRFSLQFCPMCLREGEPYYRKSWRISLLTVCTRHSCRLHDRCYNCGSPVRPLKNDIGDQTHPYTGALTACHNCAFDLRNSKCKSAHIGVVTDAKYYKKVLQRGYVVLAAKRWVYSFSFFDVLRHLIRLTVSKNTPTYDAEIDPDILEHSQRYSAQVKLSGVFLNWPSDFIYFCNRQNISYSDFTSLSKNKNPIPFWLDSVIKQKLYAPNLNPSRQSVSAAIDYMKRHRMRVNITRVNELMGFSDSGVIKRVYGEMKAKGYLDNQN